MEYSTLIVVIIISFVFVSLLFVATYFLIPKESNSEKLSSYECGFEAFQNSRNKFEVQFYLVSILFIVFDIEIMFLFPWCTASSNNINFSYFTVMLFLIILTIGFVYEWNSGALKWPHNK